jgi:hypothetical protein
MGILEAGITQPDETDHPLHDPNRMFHLALTLDLVRFFGSLLSINMPRGGGSGD